MSKKYIDTFLDIWIFSLYLVAGSLGPKSHIFPLFNILEKMSEGIFCLLLLKYKKIENGIKTQIICAFLATFALNF